VSRADRENERLKIRQDHLVKAIGSMEMLLAKMQREMGELIEVYKKKEWKENVHYVEWKAEIDLELQKLESRKRQFKMDLLETVTATPLEEFDTIT
jgi:hypothetical protein